MKKRLLCIVMIAALFSAAAEPVALRHAGGGALFSQDGMELLRADDLFSLGQGLFAAGYRRSGGMAYCLVNAGGERLSGEEFDALAQLDDALLFRKDGLVGALRGDGSVAVPAAYTALIPNGADGYLALKGDLLDNESDQIYYVDADGSEITSDAKTLSGLDAVRDGRMRALQPDANLYGYVDARGNWAIQPQFQTADCFRDGLAVASNERGYGLLDADGRWRLAPSRRRILRGEGFFALISGSRVEIVRSDNLVPLGVVVVRGASFAVVGPYLMAMTEDSVVLYDTAGAEIAAFGGMASVGAAGRWLIVSDGVWGEACCGVYTPDGTLVSALYPQVLYLGTSSGRDVFACLAMDAWGEYDEELGETHYAVDESSVRYGLLLDGKELLPPEYTYLQLLSDGLLYAEDGEECGLLGFDGEWLYRIDMENEK